MSFKIKPTQAKEEAVNKSLYIRKNLVDKIDELAKANHTSWNNVVISMIESCLADEDETK